MSTSSDGRWSLGLAFRYFRSGITRPTYFSVDPATLISIGGDMGLAPDIAYEAYLAHARSRLHPDRPFEVARREADDWRRGGFSGEPAFLDVLALTVLAADRMHTWQAAHWSFYGPLRELMGLPWSGGEGCPPSFDTDVPTMWSALRDWLDASRDRPASTMVTHQTMQYIGWALSQVVVRGADRARIADFFFEVGLRPGDLVREEELLARFQQWSTTADISDRLRKALGNSDESAVVGKVLAADLEAFDGQVVDAVGRTCLRPLPTLDRDGRLGWVVPVPPELEGVALPCAEGDFALPSQDWAELPPSLSPTDLGAGIDVDAGPVRILCRPRLAFPMLQDQALGLWRGLDAVEEGLDYRVVARVDAMSATVQVMRACGGTPREGGRAPEGWRSWLDYMPAEAALAPPGLRSLVPRAGQVGGLVGGLRVSSRHRVWLQGYEPDVVSPVGTSGWATATLNGYTQAIPVPAGAAEGRLPLSDVGLTPGEVAVTVGTRPMRFRVVERRLERLPSPQVRWVDGRWDLLSEIDDAPLEPGALSGMAILAGPVPRQLVTERSGQVFLVGEDRRSAEIFPQAAPPWLEELGIRSARFDVDPHLAGLSFTPTWLVRRLAAGRVVLPICAGHSPRARAASPSLRPAVYGSGDLHWRDAVGRPGDAVRLEANAEGLAAWMTYIGAGR